MNTLKVGTLTFHRTTNYGAVLQTYALQQVLKELDVESEVIDYRSPIIEERYEKPSFKKLLSIKFWYNTLIYNTFIRDNRKNFHSFLSIKIL